MLCAPLRHLHLSALQGISEALNEPYKRYGEAITGVDYAAERQKLPSQTAVLSGREAVRRS